MTFLRLNLRFIGQVNMRQYSGETIFRAERGDDISNDRMTEDEANCALVAAIALGGGELTVDGQRGL
jgi:hypothetical protein